MMAGLVQISESHGNANSWCDEFFDDISKLLLDSVEFWPHPRFLVEFVNLSLEEIDELKEKNRDTLDAK